MDENNRTDKVILLKGLKQMGICLILMFTGPSVFRVAVINDTKPLYIPLLTLSILICIAAIYFLYKGINTILDSIFKNKK
ncbi:DUF6095 family protein [Winogradskyella sp. PG-2]|uniref:DUF6095 family protein n=1 Tax=Winogradskyella sp. PG-2 TaxID=754409 RepID=UPI0004587901|nr:DUF6095 family protein [Winogradskyella sp. PG-2]BAO74466.1 hypothetical protein WPG_0236 [Winogradskyella sp. PG-2]